MRVTKYKLVWEAQTFLRKELKQHDPFQYFIYRIEDEYFNTYYVLTNKVCTRLSDIQRAVEDVEKNGNHDLFDDISDAIEDYGETIFAMVHYYNHSSASYDIEYKGIWDYEEL